MQKVKEEKGRPYLLLITAIIWGTGFVAQSAGADSVPTFTFSFLRNIVGAIVLIPVIMVILNNEKKNDPDAPKRSTKTLWIGGLFCGLMLFIASNLQQFAFELGSTAGNAGFITSLYILGVPIIGIFLKRKCGWNIWVSVVIAIIGLYFLCINGPFVLRPADIVLFLCAIMFSLHILVVDHYTPVTSGVCLSSIQFLFCGIFSGIAAIFTDYHVSFSGFTQMMNTVASSGAWVPILYAGAVSSGVGYTLQVVGQKNVNPTIASLLMSLESVFSVVFGWLLLHERMSGRELFGCLLVFAAVVFAQLEFKKKD